MPASRAAPVANAKTCTAPAERARAGLSIKFQITSVLPALSVYDNILLALQAQSSLGTLIRSATRRAHAAIARSASVSAPSSPRAAAALKLCGDVHDKADHVGVGDGAARLLFAIA